MSLTDRIKDYVKEKNPKLFILTPCYGGVCYVNYVVSLMKTMNLFKECNFPLQVEFCKNDSLVTRARNNLLAIAMNDPLMTHVMFIDADIMWNPIDIFKLILADKLVIGGIYPKKKFNFNKLSEDPDWPSRILTKKKNNDFLDKIVTDENMIQHNLLGYNINYLPSNEPLKVEKNLIEIKHLATGFMMINRKLIEQLIETHPNLKYTDDIGALNDAQNKFAYALFDCAIVDSHYYSEDWLFCDKCSKIGVGIWADISINLTHTGTQDYNGSYLSTVL